MKENVTVMTELFNNVVVAFLTEWLNDERKHIYDYREYEDPVLFPKSVSCHRATDCGACLLLLCFLFAHLV